MPREIALVSEPEHQRALNDVGRQLRALVSRCKAIEQLSSDPNLMGETSRWTSNIVAHLETALATIAMMNGAKLELKINGRESGPGNERVVVRCVNSLMPGRGGSGLALDSKPNVEQRKALQGFSWAIEIPQVLEFLDWLRKSGTLEVSTLAETFTVVFANGQVVHATSDQAPPGSRLGDVLVEQGALAQEQVAAFVRSPQAQGMPLGEALVKHGRITGEQLYAALEQQVRRLFLRLFSVQDATFSFYEVIGTPSDYCVRINTKALLFESAMASDMEREQQAGDPSHSAAVQRALESALETALGSADGASAASAAGQPNPLV
jgi:hypothetical protein